MSSDQPAATPEQPKPKTLVQKLCEVMAAVGYLQKTGTNTKQGYKYAREADVVAAMRPELAKRHIFIFPNVISVQRNKVERLDFDKALKFSWATDILVEWTIEDGESGETRKCVIPGCSESPGDKGVYVAMTGSEKYLLMKGFLLPTGDDPESDENEEKGSKQAASAVAKAKIEAGRQGKDVNAPVEAGNVQEMPSEGPSQLVCYPIGDGWYEVTGDSEVMEANKGLLLLYGKRKGREKIVQMEAGQLDTFRHEFCEVRGNLLTALKAKNA